MPSHVCPATVVRYSRKPTPPEDHGWRDSIGGASIFMRRRSEDDTCCAVRPSNPNRASRPRISSALSQFTSVWTAASVRQMSLGLALPLGRDEGNSLNASSSAPAADPPPTTTPAQTPAPQTLEEQLTRDLHPRRPRNDDPHLRPKTPSRSATPPTPAAHTTPCCAPPQPPGPSVAPTGRRGTARRDAPSPTLRAPRSTGIP